MPRPIPRYAAGALLAALALILPAAQPAAAAPTWLSPTPLAPVGPTGSECPPLTSADPQGDVFAVWVGQEEGNRFVQASSRPAGGSWQAPAKFPQSSPCVGGIASDARGDAVAVWNGTETVGKEQVTHIASSYRPAGGAWQSPLIIVTEPGSEVLPATVALDPSGNAVAVWRSNAAGNEIEYSSKPAAGGWQKPQPVSGETNNWYWPQIAIDGAGDAVAVWQHRVAGGKEQIQSAYMPAGGAWQPPVNLTEPFTEVFRGTPRVVANAASQATAVWGAGEPGKEIVQSSTMIGPGSWQPAVGISGAGQNAEVPQVAINARGDATAAWEFTVEKKNVIQAATRPSGAAWGAAATLSELGQDARYPHVALGPNGEATAVWERYNGTNNIIQTAVSPGGATWAPAINLSTLGESSLGTQVSMDAQGNAVAAWESHDLGGYVVYAAGYDAAGPLLNGLSIAASGIAGKPVAFSASPLDTWSALGTSSWTFGDGSAAAGAVVGHTYPAAGSYHVTLTSADALGNTTTAAGTIAIAAAAKPPTITGLRQSASTWRAGGRLARISRSRKRLPLGTTFTFTLDQPAAVTLSFTQTLDGRKIGRRCLAPGRANRGRKRCTRTVLKGTLSLKGHTGANRIAFQGRISRYKRLTPGRYKLTVTAVSPAGAAAPRSLSFSMAR